MSSVKQEAPHNGERPGDGPVRVRHGERYAALAVVATTLATLAVPVISFAGHRRTAVVWLALEVAVLTLVRARRPDGTWIAARGHRFDVVFGALLAIGLVALAYYANLPRV